MKIELKDCTARHPQAAVNAPAALRGTPNTVHPRPPGQSVFASVPAVLANRKGMLSVWAYTAHNWELLGMWAWLPAFLTAASTRDRPS